MMLTRVNIKTRHFPFTFKLTEKKKVPLKRYCFKERCGWVTKTFFLEGGLVLMQMNQELCTSVAKILFAKI